MMIPGFRLRNLKIRQMHREGYIPKFRIMIWFIDWYWLKILWVMWLVMPIAEILGRLSSIKMRDLTLLLTSSLLSFTGGFMIMCAFGAKARGTKIM